VFEGRMIVTIREIHTSPSRHVYIPPPQQRIGMFLINRGNVPTLYAWNYLPDLAKHKTPTYSLHASYTFLQNHPPTHPSPTLPAL
jgi:hypothetical protein